MKKQISLLFILTLPLLLFSQTIPETISEANKLYKEKSYKQAIDMLDKAKKEIESTYLLELKTDLLPAKIEGFITDNNLGMSQSFISGNSMLVSQVYSKDIKEEADTNPDNFGMQMPTQIVISISNISDKIFEVLNSYSTNANAGVADPYMANPIKYKEYRAAIHYEEGMKQGKFLAIIGAATIEIIGQNINSKAELLEIANKIELEKIIKSFGK